MVSLTAYRFCLKGERKGKGNSQTFENLPASYGEHRRRLRPPCGVLGAAITPAAGTGPAGYGEHQRQLHLPWGILRAEIAPAAGIGLPAMENTGGSCARLRRPES